MQTIVYQCDTAMPAQKLPNCCNLYNSYNTKRRGAPRLLVEDALPAHPHIIAQQVIW